MLLTDYLVKLSKNKLDKPFSIKCEILFMLIVNFI